MERKLFQVVERVADRLLSHQRQVLDATEQKDMVAELVQAAGQAVAGGGNLRQCLRAEDAGAGPARPGNAEFDVFNAFLPGQRLKVRVTDNPLIESLESRLCQTLFQRRLAG